MKKLFLFLLISLFLTQSANAVGFCICEYGTPKQHCFQMNSDEGPIACTEACPKSAWQLDCRGAPMSPRPGTVRDFCCCQQTTSGVDTKSYVCNKQTAEWGKEVGCTGAMEIKDMPDGGCASLELRGTTKTSEKENFGVTTSTLLFSAKSGLNPMNFSSITGVVGRLIYILLSIIGSIALVLYIYAGILWMTAAGTAERIATAKNILIWTSLGVVVTLSSYIIVNYVFGILK